MASGRSFPPQIVTCVFAADRRDWDCQIIQFLRLCREDPEARFVRAFGVMGSGLQSSFRESG